MCVHARKLIYVFTACPENIRG